MRIWFKKEGYSLKRLMCGDIQMTKCVNYNFNEEEVLNQLSEFQKSSDWFSKHIKELRGKYGDNYVAIKDGKFLLSHEDFDELCKILEKRRIDLKDVLIQFIPSDDVIWIL